jgi:hypothetical protein
MSLERAPAEQPFAIPYRYRTRHDACFTRGRA